MTLSTLVAATDCPESIAMPVFSRVLAATDHSDASRLALRAATVLTQRLGATLKVLHVLEDSAYAYPFPLPAGVREEARGRLLEVVEGLRTTGIAADAVLEEGLAAQEICNAAATTSTDLVVVGSHGRSGLPRWVHGSVAERVVRLSPVPVLTVHPSDRVTVDPAGPLFPRVLAPTDFSEASRMGVDLATRVALALGGSLTLVHVCELPTPAYVTPSDERETESHAKRELARILSEVRSVLPKAEGAIRRGNPWAEIVAAAEQGGSDLVVMSTHGRRGWARAFLGSVAEKVVRLAPAMVLTVPAPRS
jgi:nucleotide-binding universal stress UspA family protein